MSSDIFEKYPDVVDIPQLMEMLDITKYSAYKLIAEKKIKSFIVGRKYRIPKVYVIEYIKEQLKC